MHTILAQSSLSSIMDSVTNAMGAFGPLGKIILALVVFLILKKIAGIVKTLLQKGLNKTSLDDKLAAKLGAKSDISGMICTIAYLLLVIYAAVIALGVAELSDVATPLNSMLDGILGYVPNIIGAGILLYILIFLANVVKQLLANVLSAAKVDERLGSTTGTPIANSLVTAAYGFLILLFIPAVLDVLAIDAISDPIKGIVDQVTGAVPKVLLAGALIAIGIIVGQIASRVVTNLLKGTGVDQAPSKIGLNFPTEGKAAISSIVGLVVLISIAVTVFTSAISVLDIELLTNLSGLILGGYYNILLAVLVFGAGLLGSKFAYDALIEKNPIIAKIVRGLIITVSGVVALDRAGIASNLTSLPYQVAIISAGVAFGIGGAIAIGFGAREYVANFLNKRG